LRQKIEPDPSHARLLVTESGGYKLVSWWQVALTKRIIFASMLTLPQL
jgi:hypothetical protein